MAEIRSTMEMVLERAAKLAESAPAETSNEDILKKGMRLAAEFMKENDFDLMGALSSHPVETQPDIRKGMAQILLRNIVLPRDEDLQASGQHALRGIMVLSGNSGDIGTICQELSQILDQYNQHKEQTTQQLNDAIKGQLQQQQMANGQEVQEDINPAMHPQYAEELSKMLTSLNGQYNEALDQRKEAIMQRFSM